MQRLFVQSQLAAPLQDGSKGSAELLQGAPLPLLLAEGADEAAPAHLRGDVAVSVQLLPGPAHADDADAQLGGHGADGGQCFAASELPGENGCRELLIELAVDGRVRDSVNVQLQRLTFSKLRSLRFMAARVRRA